jgi:hypothetical protein
LLIAVQSLINQKATEAPGIRKMLEVLVNNMLLFNSSKPEIKIYNTSIKDTMPKFSDERKIKNH